MPNKYGHIEEIARYNRDNGTNFYRWDQVQQHRKENNPIRKFLNNPIKVPVTSGNATTFATSGNDIPKVDSTVGNELGYAAGLITTPMLFGEFAAGAIPGIVKIGGGMTGASAGSYIGGKAGDFADEKLGTTVLGDVGRFVGGLGGWGAGSKITFSQLNPINRMTRVLNRNINNIKSLELGNVPRKILFRSTVYKGGDIKDPHSIFFTTDKAYAKQFGPVKKYLFESYNPVTAKEPLIGSRDPVTMDMFVDRNIGSNQETRAILGHDLVTSDVNPSKGLEVYSFGNSNFIKDVSQQSERTYNLNKIKNSFGRRINAVLDDKYKSLSLEDQNRALFDDFLEGRRLATDFFNSDVKKTTDLENEQLAEALGLKFLKNTTAVGKINTPSVKTKPGLWLQREGDGGFYLNRELPLKESSLGQYDPSSDSITLSGLGDVQEVSMHEHLHRGRFGEAPKEFPMDESKFKSFRDTERFYQKITDDIIDPSKPFNEDVGHPSEAAANLLEIGRRTGLKLGQEYPGDKEAINIFKDIINNDELKGWMLDKFKWKDEPKKIWKALTGRYYLLPIIGYAYGNESK